MCCSLENMSVNGEKVEFNEGGGCAMLLMLSLVIGCQSSRGVDRGLNVSVC